MGAVVGVIAGVVAAEFVAASVVGATVFGVVVSQTAARVVGAVVGAAVSGVATSVLADRDQDRRRGPAPVSNAVEARARGQAVTITAVDEPIPVPYGFCTNVPAQIVYRDVAGGSANDYLYLVAIVGEGEIEGFDVTYLDGTASTDAKFAGLVTVEYHTGAAGQAASALLLADLPAKWAAADVGGGLAYAVLKLKRDDTAFPRGEPIVTFDLRGRKLKDTRDGVTRFTPNPALAIRDFWTNTRYGRKIAEARIDDAKISAEASYFEGREAVPATAKTFTADPATDEVSFAEDAPFDNGDGVQLSSTVALPGGTGAGTYYWIRLGTRRGKLAASYANAIARVAVDITSAGAGVHTCTHVDQPRYACNGLLDPSANPIENLAKLRSSCRAWFFEAAGAYHLVADKPLAGPYETWDEDIIVGEWSIDLGGEENRYNRVSARFLDPMRDNQPNFATSDNAPERADDGGKLLEGKLELAFTTNFYMAQRIAQIERRKSRLGLRVSHRVTVKGFKSFCGDVVQHTHSTPAWAGKLFRVLRLAPKADDELEADIAEYSDAVWALDGQSAMPLPVRTNLPDPSVVQPPTDLDFDEHDYMLTGEGELTWTAAADPFAMEYHPEYKLAADPAWTPVPPVPKTATSKRFTGLPPGDYEFRARTMSVTGAYSPYTAELSVTLAAPTVPMVSGLELFGAGLATTFGGRDAKFVWRAASQQDSYGVGSEPFGAGSGARDPYFKDYLVRIYHPDGSVRRTEPEMAVTEPRYTYTYEKNAEDGNGTPRRDFTIKVWTRGRQNQLAGYPAQRAVSNPQALAPAAIAVRAEFNALFVEWTPPADLDVEGIIVNVSTANGFAPAGTTPGTGNCRYKGADRLIVIDNLLPATTYYVKAACYDAFGVDSLAYSPQLSVTTEQIQTPDLADLIVTTAKLVDQAVQEAKLAIAAVTNTRVADDAISTPKIQALAITTAKLAALAVTANELAANAVTAAKIAASAVEADKLAALAVVAGKIAANAVTATEIAASAVTTAKLAASSVTADKVSISQLSAISADLGAITAGTITLNSSGHIKSGQTDWATGSGFFLGRSGGEPAFSFGDDNEYVRWKPSAGFDMKLASFEIDLAAALSSLIGNRWEDVLGIGAEMLNGVAFDAVTERWLAVGNVTGAGARLLVSKTLQGDEWNIGATAKNVNLNDVATDGAIMVAVGDADGADAYIVSGAMNWLNSAPTERANAKNVALSGICYSADLGLFVAVGAADGADAYVVTSPDGTNWTERANPQNVTLNHVCWSKALAQFVAVGMNTGGANTSPYIVTSPDGTNWTQRNYATGFSGGTWDLYGVAASPDCVIASGTAGILGPTILRSTDGINWAQGGPNYAGTLGAPMRKPAWNGSMFAVPDGNGYIVTSRDGMRWALRYRYQRGTGTAVTGIKPSRCIGWSGYGFVAVGQGPSVFTSVIIS